MPRLIWSLALLLAAASCSQSETASPVTPGAFQSRCKAGVNALTESLAKECAPAGVRVNCIAPGLVDTDMGTRMIRHYGDAILSGIPLGRAGRPEDIGRAAVYLASDDSSFVTGKILRVDGGAWM